MSERGGCLYLTKFRICLGYSKAGEGSSKISLIVKTTSRGIQRKMNIAKMKGERLEIRTGDGGMGERTFILLHLGSLV